MTGIETTVPANQSPYTDHLPDICTLITPAAMQKLGMETKTRGFNGARLLTQACITKSTENGDLVRAVSVDFYINNIKELTNPATVIAQGPPVAIDSKIRARIVKLAATGQDDPTYKYTCLAAWGTFFGSIGINYRVAENSGSDPCKDAVAAARIIAPLMPKSPSQMRVTR